MPNAVELNVNNAATAEDMINEIFGEGVSLVAGTAEYSGDAISSGIYSGATTTLGDISPTDTGVILSTGNVADFTNSSGTTDTNTAPGTSTDTAGGINGDGDMNSVSGQGTFDAAILEADFIPTGDTMTIQLVFSSEEYLEYVNGGVNDSLGLFVNGAQVDFVLGTGNISIDEITNTNNANLYRDNAAADDTFNTEMDGLTTVLTYKADVNPGQVNTFKLGIADGGDAQFDSNVLIMADSVQSVAIAADDTFEIAQNTTAVYAPLDNDIDTVGNGLTITQINGQDVVAGQTVTLGSGEAITLNADNTFTITSDGDITTSAFTYTLENGNGTTDVGIVQIDTVAAPTPDGITEGSADADLIDGAYAGDPEGDDVDANDAILPGTSGDDDSILGFGGDDTILAGAGDDTVDGGADDDLIDGGTGANSLIGGTGDDTFVGGAGADTFDGGTGQDVIDYSNSAAAVDVDLSTNTLSGGDAANDAITSGVDGVIGSDFDDSLTGFDVQGADFTNEFDGGAGSDTIDGRGGDDLITGGADGDSVLGGAGDDIIAGDGAIPEGTGVAQEAGQLFTDATNIRPGSATGDPADAQVGDSIIFDDAATLPNGDPVAIRLTVTEISDPDVTVILNSVETASPIRVDGNGDPTNAGSSVGFRVDFIDPVTGDPIILNGDATIVDIDDNSGAGEEYVEFATSDITAYGTAPGSSLTVSNSGDTVRATGTEGNAPGDQDAWLTTSFEGQSGLDFTVGVVENTANYGFAGQDLTGAVMTQTTGGDDTLSGGLGDDFISGNAGDDLIDGGDGADTILGGTGSDTITGDSGDIITGGEDLDGTDIDRLELTDVQSIAYTDVDGNAVAGPSEYGVVTFNDATTLTFAEIEEIYAPDFIVEGTAGADIIDAGYAGDPNGDVVDGLDHSDGSNNDSIIGLGGDDNITAGEGDDTVDAGADNDTVDGGAGNDTLLGQGGDDVITGGVGTDSILGGAGNDDLSGGADEDTISGGADNDTIDGGLAADVLSGDAGNDVITGGAGEDTLSGGDGLDNLSGGGDNDTIDGGGDTDTLDGGAGDDSLDGGEGADSLIGGTGNDTLLGGSGAGSDTLEGGIGDDSLNGGDGDDQLSGGVGDDIYVGEGGDDTFELGNDFGDDTLQGGETGETDGDVLDASAVTQDTTLDLSAGGAGDPESGTLSNTGDTAGFAEIETVILGSGDDAVVGSSGADNVITGIGADTVDGGAGDDTFDLGVGDGSPDTGVDVVVLQDGFDNDTIAGFEAPTDTGGGTFSGNDQFDVSGLTDDVGAPVNVDDVTVTDTVGDGSGDAILTFPNGETVTLTGVSPAEVSDPAALQAMGIPAPNYVVDGTAAGETIDAGYIGDPEGDRVDANDNQTGTDDDVIVAGAGDDTVFGLEGDDTIFGEGDNDSVAGGAGQDSIVGGLGDDVLVGGNDGGAFGASGDAAGAAGSDTIDGGAGDDTIRGNEGDDSLIGGAGNDSLLGEDGDDTIDGGDNNDTIEGGSGADSIDAGAGNDEVDGGIGNDTIDAGIGIDVIEGGDGNDSIFGNQDEDTLIGGIGDDTLSGGRSADFLEGGSGDDRLQGDEFNDTLVGGTGEDTLDGGIEDDSLSGGDEADLLEGGLGDDTLDGGSGADLLIGGSVDALTMNDTGTDGAAISSPITDFPTDQLSVEVSFASDTPPASGTPLISYATAAEANEFLLYLETGGNVLVFIDGVAHVTGIVSTSLTDGAQHTVSVTWDSVTGDLNTYVDGTLADSTTHQAGALLEAGGVVVFGQDQDSVAGGFDPAQVLNGELHEARVFDDVRTPAEVDAFDDVVLPGETHSDNLIAHWLPEADGSGLYDNVGGYDAPASGDVSPHYADGDGADSLSGGIGDDTVLGMGGDDTIILEDSFGNDIIEGGEDNEGVGDTLDLSATTTGVTVDLTDFDDEAGSVSDGTDTATFTEIENIELGAGNDTLTLADGSGDDTVSGFQGPTDNGDGTWTGFDQIDVSALNNLTGNPVTTSDVTVADDGTGNAVLSFPNGESITLFGAPVGDLQGNPAALNAIGVPLADGVISGTALDDTINTLYVGDPEGDRVDAGDNVDGSGNDEDTIQAGMGDDTIDSGLGDDTVFGGDGDDVVFLDGTLQNDSIVGGEGGEDDGGDRIELGSILGDLDIDMSGGPESGTISDGTNTTTFEEIEQLTLGAGSDSLTGSTGNEFVFGGTGDDTIIAGGGNDTIFSGIDDDSVEGGAGDDSLIGGSGADTIDGGTGDDNINVGPADGAVDEVVLQDGSGNDTVSDFEGPIDNGDGTFTGQDQFDVTGLNDNLGNPVNTNDVDVSDDGLGNALLTFPNGETVVLSGIAPAAVSDPLALQAMGIPLGSDGIVSGTAAGDLIDAGYVGDPDDDLVDSNDAQFAGQTGDQDIIEAGGGDDTVFAGDDDDSVLGEAGDDVLQGNAGEDTLVGGAGQDILLGGSGADVLQGGADEDTAILSDGFGDDTIAGGETTTTGTDTDTLEASALSGNTTVLYSGDEEGDLTNGANSAEFSQIEQVILGGGDDTLNAASDSVGVQALGGAGDDVLIGGTGDDTFFGQGDDDELQGGGGDDALDGEAGNDTVEGGAGEDTLVGDLGDDSLDGGTGADSLFGNEGDDTLTGGAGADELFGGDDDDVLNVGSGDTAQGGAGDDTFNLTPADLDGGDLTIIGGETDETVGDTLNITGPAEIVYDDPTEESGTITYYDTNEVVTFSEIENINYVPCFTPGTMIKTDKGEIPVEDVKPGTRVLTRDHGYETVVWSGRRDVDADLMAHMPTLRPILIKRGALGDALPERDMLVSPQHRVLISGAHTELWFGEEEVLIPAKHLTVLDGVDEVAADTVSYIHFMFDAHEVVMSDGCWSESFQPGDLTLGAIGSKARDEIVALFPELADKGKDASRVYPAARSTLNAHQARVLLAP